jgi:putative ABC transport system permease protein
MGWAAKRRKEFAVRRALGAGSVRILRQTLTEAAAIGAVVALIGLATAQGLLIASQQAIPIYLLHLRERTSITLVVLFGAFFLACFVSIVANLIPTFEALSLDAAEALKDNSGPLTSARGRVLRRSFVVLQVSLAFILTVGAVLSLQSFLNLTQTDLGYNTEGVFAAHLNFPAEQLCRAPSVSQEENLGSNKKSKSPTRSSAVGIRVADDACRERLLSLQSQVLRAAGALPYVSAVGAADKLPISPPRGGPWVKRDNIEKWCPELRVAGDYFRVFQIPFVAGRTFSNSVVPEMIISERTSEALWPKGNPIGDMLLVEGEKQPRQVVGVVKDTTALEIGDQPTPQIYFPLVDTSRSTPGAVSMQLVLRCERSCGGLLPALMERLKGAGADTFVDQAATMNDLGAVVTAPVRARSMLLSSYALLGFGLALVGVFVLVSYMSVLREHELGVRMVLGAEPAELVFLLAKEGIISAGIGMLVGGVASVAAVQVLKNLLFGIDVLNLKSFAIAGFLLFAGAICAAVSAALRVRSYQPSDLLRVV